MRALPCICCVRSKLKRKLMHKCMPCMRKLMRKATLAGHGCARALLYSCSALLVWVTHLLSTAYRKLESILRLVPATEQQKAGAEKSEGEKKEREKEEQQLKRQKQKSLNEQGKTKSSVSPPLSSHVVLR